MAARKRKSAIILQRPDYVVKTAHHYWWTDEDPQSGVYLERVRVTQVALSIHVSSPASSHDSNLRVVLLSKQHTTEESPNSHFTVKHNDLQQAQTWYQYCGATAAS